MSGRSRSWCFTLFPIEGDVEFVNTLGLSQSVTYLIYGNETCPTTQRHHLQGFVYFKNARTLSGLRKLNQRWHVEAMQGKFAQAIEYCKKESDFKEYGERPVDADEKALKANNVRWKLAKEGRFEELAPESIKTYEYIFSKYHEVGDRPDLLNYWISGPSGCGKSSLVRKEFADIYSKGMNKWWDGYQHEATVLLDDFDPTHGDYLAYYLKIWADHYAFNAEVKGGMLRARPACVIVTSQYPIEACFKTKTGQPDFETISAIRRRFKKITWSDFFKAFAREDHVEAGLPMFDRPVADPLPVIEVPPAPAEDFEFDESVFDDILDL